MARHTKLLAGLMVVALAACTGADTTQPPTGATSPTPTSSAPGTPIPTTTPTQSPAATPTTEPTAPPTAAPTSTPEATAATTMWIRAYFLLDDPSGGTPRLVPVLRSVPKTVATARAAMEVLLAGPTRKERNASPAISTQLPADTTLLAISVSGKIATVDLGEAFVSSHASAIVRARLAQVVYTLTQFSSIDFVEFLVEGRPIATWGDTWYDYDAVLQRVIFWDDLLPPIFVDRPAWGASYASGSDITGLATVFEAQFRAALLAADGRVLADRQVTAACGDGCWSDFHVALPYHVANAQLGSLRVWDTSEADGTTIDLRVYPVWLGL